MSNIFTFCSEEAHLETVSVNQFTSTVNAHCLPFQRHQHGHRQSAWKKRSMEKCCVLWWSLCATSELPCVVIRECCCVSLDRLTMLSSALLAVWWEKTSLSRWSQLESHLDLSTSHLSKNPIQATNKRCPIYSEDILQWRRTLRDCLSK